MKCQHPICQFGWVVIMSTPKLVFAGFEVSIWDSHCRHHKQHTGSIESTFVKFPMLQTWNEFGQQVEWRLKSGWFPHWGAYWPSSSASRGASVASLVRWSWSPYWGIRLSHSYVGSLKVWYNCISHGNLSFRPSFNAFRKRILVLVWILAWYAGLLSGKPHHCEQIRIHHTRTEPWIVFMIFCLRPKQPTDRKIYLTSETPLLFLYSVLIGPSLGWTCIICSCISSSCNEAALLQWCGLQDPSFLQYHHRSGSSFHLKGKVVTLQTVEIVDRSRATLFVGPPSKPPPLQKLQDLNNGP
jgi:hypothetical protein